MYRTLSTSRIISDDFSVNVNLSPAARGFSPAKSSSATNGLPVLHPLISHATKKDNSRRAENAVHLIPLLLFLCAFILWVFSTPIN
ncbi:uncharacterized protein LOC127795849 [Diospyros lotus]|uniref:uncharacterized protein LOC127795849 n=1 Tax=Diospyros lotus TaxID=55363 RepID=UPI00225655CA|nr:uncharacterized protein LOC127795849 [Diospyros lotus]